MKTICNSWYWMNGIKCCSSLNTTGCRMTGDVKCGLNEEYATEREAKLQERLDLQIYANDSLLAQNRGLMELCNIYKNMDFGCHCELCKGYRQQITALEKELGLNKEGK